MSYVASLALFINFLFPWGGDFLYFILLEFKKTQTNQQNPTKTTTTPLLQFTRDMLKNYLCSLTGRLRLGMIFSFSGN